MNNRVDQSLPVASAPNPNPRVTAGDRAIKLGMKNAATGAGATLIGTIISALVAFGSEVVIARLMGVETYGLYGLGYSISKICSLISMFGLPLTLFHFLPNHAAKKRGRFIAGTLLAAIVGPILLGCGLLLPVWFAAPFVARRLFNAPDAVPYIRILALSAPLLALTNVLANATRALGHPIYLVLVRNVVPAVLFALLVSGIFMLQAAPVWVPIAFLGANLGALSAAGLATVRVAGTVTLFRKPIVEWRKTYRYAFPIAVNMLLYVGISWTDLLVVGHYLGASGLGIYRACMQIVLPFDMLWFAFTSATAHLYAPLFKSQDNRALADSYEFTVRWSTLFSIPLGLIVASNSSDILKLLGPDFASGALALSLLTAAQVIRCSFGGSGVLLAVTGRQNIEATNAIIAAIAALILNFALVPKFGIVGAASATLCTIILFHLCRVVQVYRYFHISTVRVRAAAFIVISVAITIAVMAVADHVGLGSGGGLTSLLARGGLEAASMLMCIWVFGVDEIARTYVRNVLAARSKSIGSLDK